MTNLQRRTMIPSSFEERFDKEFPGDVTVMQEDGAHAMITSSLYNRDSLKAFIKSELDKQRVEIEGEWVKKHKMLFELSESVEESIKKVTGFNQIFKEQNRKELSLNLKVLLGYIRGLSNLLRSKT